MHKELQKSKKLVQESLSRIPSVIVDIDKATKLLTDSITRDENLYDNIVEEIRNLENRLDEISRGMVLKQNEITKNNKLKDSLTSFIHGGRN